MWKRVMLIGLLAALGVVVLSVGGLFVLSLTARRPDDVGTGKLAPCPDTPNGVSSQAEDEMHRVEPLRFDDTPGAAWAHLVIVVSGMPRTNVVTVDDAYLHAECSSAVFRFVDDVEFVLDADNRLIHCRSAARVGRSDLGVNRERIETIRTAWEKAK